MPIEHASIPHAPQVMIALSKAMFVAVDAQTKLPSASPTVRASAYSRQLVGPSSAAAASNDAAVPGEVDVQNTKWPLNEYGLRLGARKSYSLPLVCDVSERGGVLCIAHVGNTLVSQPSSPSERPAVP